MANKDTLAPSQGGAAGLADTLPAPKPYQFLNQRHTMYQRHHERWSRRWHLIFGDVESDQGKRAFLPAGTDENDGFYNDRVKMSEIIPEMPPVVRRVANKIFSEEIVREWRDNEDLSTLEKNMDGRRTKAKTFMRTIARKVAVLGVMHVLCDKPAWPTEEERRPKTLEDERAANLRLPFFVAYSPLEVVNWSTDRNNNLLWAIIKIVRHDMDAVTMAPITLVEYTKWSRHDWTRWMFKTGGTTGAQLEPVTTEPNFGKPVAHNVGRVPLTQIYFDFVEPMIGQGLSDEAFRADLLKIRAESNLTWDGWVHAHPQLVVWTEDDLGDVGVGANTLVKLNPAKDEDVRYVSPEGSSFEINTEAIERQVEATIRHQGVDPLGVITKKGVRSESGVKAAWTFKTSEEQILQNFSDSLQSGEENMFEDASRLLSGQPQPFGASVFADQFGGSVRYPKKFDLTSPKERMEQFVQAKKHVKSKTLLEELAVAIGLAFVSDLPSDKIDMIDDEIRAIDFTAEGQFDPGALPPGDEGEEE